MMRKVLVVEDEPKIANMERDFLEGAGFEPYVTDNGEEALKIMDEVKSMLSSLTSCFRERMDSLFAAKCVKRLMRRLSSQQHAQKMRTSSEVWASALMTTS